jgi:hypothetical protein
MAGHTPGPWVAATSGPLFVAQAGGANPIAGAFSDVRGGHGTAEANARLIAAAPEMYEALKAFLDDTTPERDCYRKALAAVAKAEGKTIGRQLAAPA